MTFVVAAIMETDPRHLGEVFHLTLEQDPRGSPSEEGWEGGRFSAHGIQREKTVRFLRRLAERLEQGASVAEISGP